MGCVGLFFVVGKKLLLDCVSDQEAEVYGEFLVYDASHFDVWLAKHERIYHKSYDYYPRGRVVCHQPDHVYTVYVDRCIDDTMLTEIIHRFHLQDELHRVDRSDTHYVCHRCSKDHLDMD